MQRSLGDEVLIAIIAVAVIAFATAFGVILSLVTTEPVDGTPAPTEIVVLATLPPTATINFTPFATFTREASVTLSLTTQPSANPTATTDNPSTSPTDISSLTPTVTLTASAPASLTFTPTPSATNTASHTPTASPTDVLTPTPTITPSDTPSLEPSVTDTLTPHPSVTATEPVTLTATAMPSLTSTRTATATPSLTSTRTATATPSITSTPFITLTATSTHTATRTPSLVPSATRISTITLVPTLTLTPTATSFAVDCEFPERWARITTQQGDTLESLAALAGVPVERVIRRNCLPDDAQVVPGDALLLPATGEVSSAPTDAVIGCDSPSIASIDGVRVGALLRGMIEIRGTVGGVDFRRYRLEIRPNGYLRYNPILTGNTPVNGRALGVLDTTALPLGLAWLRVVVTNDTGVVGMGETCAIPIFIR